MGEELEQEELIPPADQTEDEFFDESSADAESASLREDEGRLNSPGGFVAGESHLERFSDYGVDELSLDGEREWEHSELKEDFDPDLEGENGSLAPLGRSDFWPDVVYIVKEKDSFLSAAREFHTMWGLKHMEFESFETLIGLVAKAKIPEKRIRVISHAWDGFKVPLFTGSPAGFLIKQEQIEALNAGDGALMDELLGTLVDLDQTTNQGSVLWNALLSQVEFELSGGVETIRSNFQDQALRRPGSPFATVRGSCCGRLSQPGVRQGGSQIDRRRSGPAEQDHGRSRRARGCSQRKRVYVHDNSTGTGYCRPPSRSGRRTRQAEVSCNIEGRPRQTEREMARFQGLSNWVSTEISRSTGNTHGDGRMYGA